MKATTEPTTALSERTHNKRGELRQAGISIVEFVCFSAPLSLCSQSPLVVQFNRRFARLYLTEFLPDSDLQEAAKRAFDGCNARRVRLLFPSALNRNCGLFIFDLAPSPPPFALHTHRVASNQQYLTINKSKCT